MKRLLISLAAGLALTAAAATPSLAQSTLDKIKAGGHITGGTSEGVPGFSLQDKNGVWHGFDTDVCRALSAAIFNDPDKATYLPLSSKNRLVALQAEWRHRGIQKPFEVRMGINTGYCNVGNFGSLDRMDYTIVGAEANLAARLQSIAEPGGIVLSYETYALVEDSVKARALPAITLKGISRKIVPYMVEGILDPTSESPTTINEINNGLTLFLDTAKLDGESAERARQILEKAIAAVKSKGLSGETDQQPTPG